MNNKKDLRFFPIFIGATWGVILEIISTFIDEIVVGNIFNDEAFAAVNLIEPYTYFEVFLAYLVCVGGAALIVRAQGAGDRKKMSEIFSQTMILCGLCGIGLTLLYVLFTPQLVRLVADDPAVYDNALQYFKAMRFYPLVDMFDTFMFTYVLYRGGYVQFYIGIFFRIVINTLLSYLLGSAMGLMGIGIASIISLLIASLIKMTFLLTQKHGLKFRWYFNVREALEIAKLGFPEGVLYGYFVILEMAVNTFTLKHYAAAGVAAVAVVINVFEFVSYLSEGISEYEIVAVNTSIGQGSSKNMDRSIRITLRAAMIEGVALVGLVLLAANVLPAAFDIDNPDTARLAAVLLRIFAPTAIFICLSRVTAIFYQYTRRIRRTLILFGLCVAVLPAAFGMLLGQFHIWGIAVGMAFGPAVAFGLMYVYVRYMKKEKLFDYTLMHLD